MSAELVLTQQLTVSMTLTGDGATLTLDPDPQALALTLAPILVVGSTGVSGPDIYAFAADQG